MREAVVVVVAAACGGAAVKPAPAPIEHHVATAATAKCSHDCLPDLKFVDTRGVSHDVAGKVVVVTFFATWCHPCQKQVEAFAAIDNAVVLALLAESPSPSDADVEQFLRTFRAPNLPVVRATSEFMVAWNYPQALPTTFIYDKTGTQVFTHVGPMSADDLRAALPK